MSTSFFPKNRTFWLYHGAGLLAFAAIEVATSVFAPNAVGFKLFAGLVMWPLLFTLCVLGFRWAYKHYSFLRVSVGKLIPLVVGYSLVAAVVASTIITALLLPIFITDFIPQDQFESGQYNLLKIAQPIIVSASLFGHLFIMAWAFIYVFVIENRHAKEAEINNLRLQNSLKEMQLSSLASQLNPHFLFNSLNNIRFMIHENTDRADQMITELSDILRYSLTTGSQGGVVLSDELSITQKYIDVMGMQYEDKLRYTCEVDDTLLHQHVPPMCIQMLVENAVKHGLEHRREGGLITVQVRAERDRLLITVTNPIAEGSGSHETPGTGSGLSNIRNRLQLLYGDLANLETERTDTLFKAELVMPRVS